MNEIQNLELLLNIANKRFERASAALAAKHKGGEWEEFRAAHKEVLSLERQLAAKKGEVTSFSGFTTQPSSVSQGRIKWKRIVQA